MILVTGGAGLLGNALIEMLLKKGEKVRVIYNSTALVVNLTTNFQTIQCDILDVYALEDAMQGVTEVYHCAGLVSFNPKDEKKLYSINVEGTANIVNAALNAGVRKLVHVSSVAALGRIRPDEMIDETMVWTEETSNSKYGHSKYLGEMEVWRGVAEGLNAVVINPSIILGAGNWNEISLIKICLS
jgi:dihydroflavonol-4-reductase